SPPDPAFDGAERGVDALGDFRMRKAVDKGQHNALPLLIVEQLEATFQGPRLRGSVDLLYDIGLERCVAERRIVRQNLAAELAHRIQGTETDDPGEPRRSGAALGREGGGILPDLNKSLLQHIGSDLRSPHDPEGNAVEPPGLEFVEPLQRSLTAASN